MYLTPGQVLFSKTANRGINRNNSVNKLRTRKSAIADKPRDAFRGQSRSPNMLPFGPFHMIGMVSY